jgi:hypothetical protein
LWVTGGDEADEKTPVEDLNSHNIYAIRERMQMTYTNLIKRGFSTSEIAQKMGTGEQAMQYFLNGVFDEINRFEDMGRTVVEGDPEHPVSRKFISLAEMLLADPPKAERERTGFYR